jgi:hypothetical protein
MSDSTVRALNAGADIGTLAFTGLASFGGALLAQAQAAPTVTWPAVVLSLIGVAGIGVRGWFNLAERRLDAERLRLENEFYRATYGPPGAPKMPGAKPGG